MNSDKVFEALASVPRRRILAFLSKADLTAGDIAARFAMSQPAVSKHLSVLENAGLVWREKRGQHVHYGLIEEGLRHHLVHFLSEVLPVSRADRQAGRALGAERRVAAYAAKRAARRAGEAPPKTANARPRGPGVES